MIFLRSIRGFMSQGRLALVYGSGCFPDGEDPGLSPDFQRVCSAPPKMLKSSVWGVPGSYVNLTHG